MTTTQQPVKAELSTDLDQDDYELELDYAIEHCLNPWLEAHGIDEGDDVVVRYAGATWQRLQGATTTTSENLLTQFGVNGEYRLDITYDPAAQTLTLVRYSHDEPTGASHEFEKLPA